jgi:hypothetical protein
MKPIKFEEQNFNWGAPKGEEDKVGGMTANRGVEEGTGWPLSISCWEPTPEDLKRLNEGGKIWLRVYGQGHPPVSISTEHPWNEKNEIPKNQYPSLRL